MKIKYEADDGKLFDSAEAAKAHEEAIVFKPLLGLDEARLMLALQRHPDALDIAEALEKAGTRIASLRRASGDLKRRGKSEPEPAGAPQRFPVLETDDEEAERVADDGEAMSPEDAKQFAEDLVGGIMTHSRLRGYTSAEASSHLAPPSDEALAEAREAAKRVEGLPL